MLQFVHHYHSNTIVDLIGQEREDKYIVSRRVYKFRHLDFRVLTTVCEISEFIPLRTLGSELSLVGLQGYKTWKWKDGGRWNYATFCKFQYTVWQWNSAFIEQLVHLNPANDRPDPLTALSSLKNQQTSHYNQEAHFHDFLLPSPSDTQLRQLGAVAVNKCLVGA